MRFLLPIAILALLCAQANAGEKLSVGQVIMVGTGLSQLDGYERVIKDGGQEKAVKDTYKFGGGLRLLIATNIDQCRRVIEAYQKAHTSLAQQFGTNGKPAANDDPRMVVENVKMLEAPANVDLVRIKAAELRLDENPIPASTLSMLMPIMDQ